MGRASKRPKPKAPLNISERDAALILLDRSAEGREIRARAKRDVSILLWCAATAVFLILVVLQPKALEGTPIGYVIPLVRPYVIKPSFIGLFALFYVLRKLITSLRTKY